MIKAILFDLDGVLVDATNWHYLAFNKALEKISGISISKEEHEKIFNGSPTLTKLNILVKQGRVFQQDIKNICVAKQEFTKQIIKDNAKLDLEKIYMHQHLKRAGFKIACVTNSITETAKLMLEITGQLKFINLLISNEMVVSPKPNPEGYIRAMMTFDYFPHECLVVEDSPKGVEAAKLSGADVFIVKNYNEVIFNNIKKYLE